METAEEALAAFARDLVEEIAAGRAFELAADSALLELSWVKPFQRTERVHGRLVTEQVGGHQDSRPGHIPEPDWAKGEKEWTAKGEAVWKKNEWKAKGKPKTPDQVAAELKQTADASHDMLPSADFAETRQKLHSAAGWLTGQRDLQKGKIDQTAAGRAYHELHQAHQYVRAQVLPHARPEDYPAVAEHLQKIAGHMQDLGRALGANPDLTRQTLGDFGEAFAQAGQQRRAEIAAVKQADQGWYQRRQDERQALAQGRDAFIRFHLNGRDPSQADPRAIALFQAAYEEMAREAGVWEPPVPEPKTGAAAVHPHLGQHLAKLPGDTVSGHAHKHVPQPFPVGQPSVQDVALGEAHAALGVHRQAAMEQIDAQQAAAEAQRTGIPAPGTYEPLDDEEYMLHTLRAENAIAAAYDAGHATAQSQTLDGHGQVWTPERAGQHKDIVRHFLTRAAAVPSEHRAVVMGGLPGAGKTTVLGKDSGVDLSRYAVINPDDIKAEMARRGMVPEVEGLSPMEASSLVHQESSHVSNLLTRELTRRGKNVALDIAMSGRRNLLPRLDALHKAGYRDVHGVFVHIPVETSVERTRNRHREGLEAYRQGRGQGGRLVPSDLIRAAETGPGTTVNRETFDKARNRFSSWDLWDNSGSKPQLAERSEARPGGPGIPAVEDLAAQKQALDDESAARAAELGSAGGQ